MLKFDYVIYHKNCLDGFAGFFVLTQANSIKENAIVYPDIPSTKFNPPNIKNKNVVIIDVAYNKNILKYIFSEAKYVLFIDHHVSIRADVLELITYFTDIHHVVYDSSKSGASLTWEYFFPNKKIPRFIKYIEDNDIGLWVYKYTFPFITSLRVNYKLEPTKENIKKWEKLYDKKEVKKLIKNGLKYIEYENYLLEINSKRYSYELFPGEKVYNDNSDFFEKAGQYKVIVYNGTGCPSVSLLGKKFVDDYLCDFSILWTFHLDKKEYVLSFRSNSVDVSEIAKIFGGGGHKFAASCSIPHNKYSILDLFFTKSLPRTYN